MAETLQATVIGHNQAIRLRARKECLDRYGTRRVTGSTQGQPGGLLGSALAQQPSCQLA